jgi:glycerophosphoryl diester phosphodiesterase
MRSQKDILIASHRGSTGMAIVDNTLDSFDIAIRQGADILEMDVAMTLDDELFVIHDGMEKRLFQIDRNVQDMDAAQLRQLRYYTLNGTSAGRRVNTFDEVLEHLKGRCLINLDRTWVHPDEWKKWEKVFAAVDRHHMEDQIIFKSAPEDKYIRFFAGLDKPYMYMPMAETPGEVDQVLRANINVVMVEVHFDKPNSPMADPALYERLQTKNIYTWGNAITLGGEHIQAGGHDDNRALTGDPDDGWGWFADHKFDVVQTDWVLAMRDYFTQKGYRV